MSHDDSFDQGTFDAIETIETVASIKYTPTNGEPVFLKITENRSTIGRGKEAKLRIPEPTVSKIHAVIYRRNRNYFILDCASTNQTFIGSNKVEAIEQVDKEGNPIHPPPLHQPLPPEQIGEQLNNGDIIALGHCFVTFVISTEKVIVQQSKKDRRSFRYEEGVEVTAESDFPPIDQITDVDALKRDYERLRVAYLFNKQGFDFDFENMTSKALVCTPSNLLIILFYTFFRIFFLSYFQPLPVLLS